MQSPSYILEHMVIDGKKIADEILGRLAAQPKPEKFLAAIQVGDDAATASFIALKERTAKKLGIDFRTYRFPADIENDELRQEFGKIAAHKTCGGVMVELPMPEHLNWYYTLNAIPPEKDVDILGERAIGAFYNGRSKVLPPAVAVVEEIVKFLASESGDDSLVGFLASQSVAVVGLGLLIGRPVATWIMRRAKETFLVRSTSDRAMMKHADIVIAGVGRAGIVTADMVKSGAVIIDFGYDGGKGDFDPSGLAHGAAAEIRYTPTPGGTGPILVAKLFENFYQLTQD